MLEHSTHNKLATSFDTYSRNLLLKENTMKKSYSEHTYFVNPAAISEHI